MSDLHRNTRRTVEVTPALVEEIVHFVVENGRVEGQGVTWNDSLWQEVQFESSVRGFKNSGEIADLALTLWGEDIERPTPKLSTVDPA